MPTAYQYTGQLSQMEQVGLYHYGARWFDPAGAHFTQADTLIPGVGNPLSWDRYAYVNDNPINYTDPTGHMQVCADGDEGGGCGTGSTTEQIWLTFADPDDGRHKGVYDGLFSEYYAKLHQARVVTSRGDPNADIYWADAATAKEVALNFFPQKEINPIMFISPEAIYRFSQFLVGAAKDLLLNGGGNIVSASFLAPSVKAAWSKSTFNTVEDSITYHYQKHGEPWKTAEEYTEAAQNFYTLNIDMAKSHKLNSGEIGVKITTDQFFGIYTADGRIISFGPK